MIPQYIKDTASILIIAAMVAGAFYFLQIKTTKTSKEQSAPTLNVGNDSIPVKGELLIVDSITKEEVIVRPATKEDAKAFLKKLKDGKSK